MNQRNTAKSQKLAPTNNNDFLDFTEISVSWFVCMHIYDKILKENLKTPLAWISGYKNIKDRKKRITSRTISEEMFM